MCEIDNYAKTSFYFVSLFLYFLNKRLSRYHRLEQITLLRENYLMYFKSTFIYIYAIYIKHTRTPLKVPGNTYLLQKNKPLVPTWSLQENVSIII